MNNYEKLLRLKKARERVAKIDIEKIEIFEEIKDVLGLDSRFNNDIWDYLINGLQFLRNDIADALKIRENYKNQNDYKDYDEYG